MERLELVELQVQVVRQVLQEVQVQVEQVEQVVVQELQVQAELVERVVVQEHQVQVVHRELQAQVELQLRLGVLLTK
jgi:hypothetical protein